MSKQISAGGIFLFLGLALLWWSHGFIGSPLLSNDSVQYLDGASHLEAHDCFCTTVAHFDEQLAVGHMPIPFTHFAPGLSLLMTGLARIGVEPETAGYLISAFAYLGTIALFWYIGTTLGAGPLVLGLLALVWTTNSTALLMANYVSTESLFTLLLLSVAALIVADIETKGKRPLLLAGIGIAAGASYWIRYPGIFLVPVAVFYLIWRWRQNRQTLPWAVIGLVAVTVECLVIMIRNTLIAGSWRGGFSTGQGHTVKWVLVESGKAWYHLVFGDRVVARLDIWVILFLCALPAAVALAIFAWRSDQSNQLPAGTRTALGWLFLMVGTYCAGIVYGTLHSIAADLSRYYFPAYPLLLAILAVVSLARRPVESAVAMVLVGSILAIHSRSLFTKPNPSLIQGARQLLAEDVQSGTTMEQWISEHTTSRDVILATNGQAAHYVLQRPVLAVIDPAFSVRKHDETSFHELMAQFGARYVLLFPGSKTIEEQDDIPFLQALAQGTYPSWLTPAARSKDTVLYECAGCIKER